MGPSYIGDKVNNQGETIPDKYMYNGSLKKRKPKLLKNYGSKRVHVKTLLSHEENSQEHIHIDHAMMLVPSEHKNAN